jgi:hypothetical protein
MGPIYTALKAFIKQFGEGSHDMFEFIEKYLEFITKI